MARYLKFLAFGVVFVGVQEFWVSYIWRGEMLGFALAVLVIEVPFLSLAFWLSRKLPPRLAALGLFLVMGGVGLLGIEWLYVGNTPTGSDASQLVMFATWGGAAVFALLQSDERAPKPLQCAVLWGFLLPAAMASLAALASPPELAFALTYRVAVTLYPVMVLFWGAYAWHQIREYARPPT